MSGQHALLPGRPLQHGLLQKSLVHHIQLPCAAGLIQHQKVCRFGHGGGKVRILQRAGLGLFGVVHLKNEFLPGLAAVELCTQLLQQRDLAALPALEKLQHGHPFSAAQRPQSKPHGRRCLALSVAVIKMHKSGLFHFAFLTFLWFYPSTAVRKAQCRRG